MAFTLTELQTQRDSLRLAARSGVLTVTHGDKSVKYRSMKELQAALSDIEAEIGQLTGCRRRRVRYFSTTKGL